MSRSRSAGPLGKAAARFQFRKTLPILEHSHTLAAHQEH